MANNSLSGRLDAMRPRIAEACARAGRRVEDTTLIVVTKFHPAQLVRDLYDLGVRDVGENRHQEARGKAGELADLDQLRWHYIGQLQTNKARQIFDYASAIHSVDRARLVDALDRAETDAVLDAFVQVNLTSDPRRGGVSDAEFEALAERVLSSPRLSLRGVMAVAPLDEDPRPAFERLAGYSERLRRLAPDARDISAGMSHDFAEALEFGATHLRIGTAITGKRENSQ